MNAILAACTIFCSGDVLKYVQLSGIYNDSKTFVDMPMKFDPSVVLANFATVGNPSDPNEIRTFVNSNFETAGSDLLPWIPTDYSTSPNFINKITDPAYKVWASNINQLWLSLGRQTTQAVADNPERHSFLPYEYPFIMPGGRFRESYYWDTWFIVRGLLVCDMHVTAGNIVKNLLNDVVKYGFVPNGGRIYYLDRSQPPVLSEMVMTYFNYMKDKFGMTGDLLAYLNAAFPLLESEYSWWMSLEHGHAVNIGGSTLNRYFSNASTPRPESFKVDFGDGSMSSSFYRNTRAGAESGWDFSSRWFSVSTDKTTVATSELLPIELNSIMYRFEQNLAKFAQILADDSWKDVQKKQVYEQLVTVYSTAASNRKAAMTSLLWDASTPRWRDFNITSHSFTASLSIASWIPMWAGLYNEPVGSATDVTPNPNVAVESFLASGLLQVGGVLTTILNTGQQWDAPNAWPPLVMLTIDGLHAVNTPLSLSIAANLSALWLDTGIKAYLPAHFMYEKYNAFNVGVGGGGGEYKPQTGFGWTNGVALVLLAAAYPNHPPSDDTNKVSGLDQGVTVVLAVVGVLLTVVMLGALWHSYNKKRLARSTLRAEQYPGAVRYAPVPSSALDSAAHEPSYEHLLESKDSRDAGVANNDNI